MGAPSGFEGGGLRKGRGGVEGREGLRQNEGTKGRRTFVLRDPFLKGSQTPLNPTRGSEILAGPGEGCPGEAGRGGGSRGTKKNFEIIMIW